MLRMSKLTDYGTMVLAQLAANAGRLSTAGQVADATHLRHLGLRVVALEVLAQRGRDVGRVDAQVSHSYGSP